MFTLLRKEIFGFFSAQTAYLIIGVFLLMTGLLLWITPDYSILSNGYASLQSLFDIAPYIFIFLIPAITMRAIAEEKREGTYELLVTRPLTAVQIIAAKYLSSLIIVWLSLLPTLFYAYTVYQLGLETGNLDMGATLGSYIGLLLLSASFTAVGIFSSTISKNQVISFITAGSISLFLFLGFDLISNWPVLGSWDFFLKNIGIAEHYQAISRGVLDFRDLFYFIDVILVFLFLSIWMLNKHGISFWIRDWKNWLIICLIFLFNLAGSIFLVRIDFTEDKRYTLSGVTRSILSQLKEPLEITIYLDGDLPTGFKRLRNASRDLLTDFDRHAGSNIKIRFINPLEGSTEEQEIMFNQLADLGIEPTNLSVKTEEGLSQKTIFPAALISSKGSRYIVKLLQNRMGTGPEEVLNNSIQNLEFTFISAITKLSRGEKPRIGFTEGHGELSDLQLNDAIKSLQDAYDVGRVDLASITASGLDKISLLVIPKPETAFTEAEKYKLNYFVMQGGSILWTIDQVNAELDSLKGSGEQLAFAKKLNLDDMLFKYGIRMNYNLIADMNCAQIPLNVGNMAGQGQIQMLPWLFYPVFMPLTAHPLVKNLDGIKSEFAGTLDTIPVKGIKKDIILSSSPYSRTAEVPVLISLQMLEEQPDPQAFNDRTLAFAALLEGSFPSLFKDRPNPEGIDGSFPLPPKGKNAKMIVLADGDILKNQIGIDGSPYPLGYDRYSQMQFGNKAFLLNAVDYLAGNADLISVRNKELKIRLLDKARIKTEKRFWQAFNLALPLILLAITGFFQHWYRKRRYTV